MASLTSSLHPTYGFHPTLRVAFNVDDDNAACSLHLRLSLPPVVFVDPYELENYKADYTFQHAGPSNLELPVAGIPSEHSYVLLNVSTDNNIEIPLHLRYGAVGSREYETVDIPSPEGFLSCKGLKGARNVSSNISYHQRRVLDNAKSDIMFRMPQRFSTLFSSTHVVPVASAEDIFQLQVPVGQTPDLPVVETGTALTILFCFAYLVYVSLKTATRLRNDSRIKQF